MARPCLQTTTRARLRLKSCLMRERSR
jgi:hypothetical protein